MKVTTPKGEIRWATISGAGKEDLNGRLIYTVDVVMPVEEAQPLIDDLNAFWEENKPKGAKAPKSMGFKQLEDGDICFTLKTATTYPKSGDPKNIVVYNAAAKRIEWPSDKKIGNGSVGRASGMAAIYDAGVAARGVTLYLDAIQLVKLVEYVQASSFDADDEGDFDGSEETDGFVAEELV